MIGAAKAVLVLGLLGAGVSALRDLAPRIHLIAYGNSVSSSGPNDPAPPTGQNWATGAPPGAEQATPPPFEVPGAGVLEPSQDTLPGLIGMAGALRIETDPIRFNSGEPDMRPDSLGALQRLAVFLKEQPGLEIRSSATRTTWGRTGRTTPFRPRGRPRCGTT